MSLCSVSQGSTQLLVAARSDPNGVALLNLFVEIGLQLIEEFGVYDKAFFVFPDMALTGADFNAATRQITLDFSEIESEFGELLTVHTVFTLTTGVDTSVVTETISMTSHTSELIQGRLYVLSDFDLKGTPNDDTATANLTTKKITFADADGVSTGVVEHIGGTAPGAFQVSNCCQLSIDLGNDVPVILSGSVAQGPGDLQAAHSWDRNISGFGSFSTTLRKTVTLPVPEPSVALLQTAALACWASVTRLARHGRQGLTRRRGTSG